MSKLTNDIGSLFYLVASEARKLTIPEDGPVEHIAALTLYGRILEITDSCIVLLNAGKNSTIPLLVRPILDAYIDLAIVTHDPEYVKNMRASELKERTKLFNNSLKSNGENPYLEDLAALPVLADMLDTESQELATLRAEKRSDMDAYRRFELAGMKDMHPALFNRLSEHVHNNMKVIRYRILCKSENGLSLHHSVPMKDDELFLYLDTMGMACAGGMDALFRILGMRQPQTIEKITKALEAVHAHWED
jgi:hypothetical protein